jgi:hypothetical protein
MGDVSASGIRNDKAESSPMHPLQSADQAKPAGVKTIIQSWICETCDDGENKQGFCELAVHGPADELYCNTPKQCPYSTNAKWRLVSVQEEPKP